MTFKNYMKKTLNHFIHFTSSHFSLTVKIYVALGMVTLSRSSLSVKVILSRSRSYIGKNNSFTYFNLLVLCV